MHNVVWCIAKKQRFCSHIAEKCSYWNGNHIALGSRCAKKVEPTRDARERRRRQPARQTMEAMEPISETTRTAYSLTAKAPEGGKRGSSEEEMADEEEQDVEAADVRMVESMMSTTMEMPASSSTGTATAVGSSIESNTEW
jgi:hypothetical protein